MIGGFVVGADANIARVVIRAIGPSLTRFGITHPLSIRFWSFTIRTEDPLQRMTTGRIHKGLRSWQLALLYGCSRIRHYRLVY